MFLPIRQVRFLVSLIWRGGYRLGVIGWSVLGTYDTVSSQVFSEYGLPTFKTLIGWWDWKTWVLIFVVIVAVALFDWAYRKVTPTEERRATTNKLAMQCQAVAVLINERINGEAEYNLWKGKVDSWQNKTTNIVRKECLPAELTVLTAPVGAKRVSWEYHHNAEHNHILTELDHWHTALLKLIDRYLGER